MRPEGATQRHPIARSVDRRSYSGDLHGILRKRTRATDQVGCMAWMGTIAAGRMANPITHKVVMLLGDEGEVVSEVPVDDGEDEPTMETV